MELYTLTALAKKEGVHKDYLRHMLCAGNKEWRGWKFHQVGDGRRSIWLANNGTEELTIHDD